VLDATNTKCVDNTLCSPFLETCTSTEYSLQQQNGCVCFTLPTLPTPCCAPTCGATTTTTTTTTTSTSTTSTSTTSTTSTSTTSTTTSTSTTSTTAGCNPYSLSHSGSSNDTTTLPIPGGNGCGGAWSVTITPPSQGPQSGFIFTVSTDLGPVGVTGCLTSGTVGFSLPAGASSVTVVVAIGCNGTSIAGSLWTWSAIG
jgi:hypothetical protein